MIHFYLTNTHFDDIYINMCKQFPKKELKSLLHFKKLLNTDLYKAFRCFDNDIEVGYLICFVDEFILVDYLAVYAKYQSMGYGEKILKAFFNKNFKKKAVFFEVEKIDFNNETTIRRQKFYSKIGCINSGINYLFPNNKNPILMDLLYYPLSEKIPSKKHILNFIKKFFDNIHYDVKEKDEIYSKIS